MIDVAIFFEGLSNKGGWSVSECGVYVLRSTKFVSGLACQRVQSGPKSANSLKVIGRSPRSQAGKSTVQPTDGLSDWPLTIQASFYSIFLICKCIISAT